MLSYIIGGLILIAFFTAIGILTAQTIGTKETILTFVAAIIGTAIVAFAAVLLTGGIKF